MERMLVVVFDDEAKAQEGSRALQGLGEDSIIAVHASRVVTKDPDGTITPIKTYEALPEGTMGATAVGSLIGMFGGPVGLAVGAASGFVIGATTDLARARVANDFVGDVEQMLRPGRSAVVAAIDEESGDPVNARMTACGGSVLRRDLSDVWDSEYEQDVAAIETDIARTKAEYSGGNHV